MTVQLLEAIRIAGTEQGRGVAVDAAPGLESQLIAEGSAKDILPNLPGIAIFGDEAGYIAPSFTAGSGAVVNSSGVERIGDDICAWMSITANSATNNWVEMQFNNLLPFVGREMQFEYSLSNQASGHTVVAYLVDSNTSPVRFMNYSHATGAASTSTVWGHGGRGAAYVREADWTKTGFADAADRWQMTQVKFRVFVTNGQTQLFRLFRVRVNSRRRKGRLVAYSDDGYRRWLRFGQPILEAYGIPVTMAVIPSLVGNASYVSWPQLRRLVAAGNEVVAHGPDGGTGNLFTRWASDDDALADMVSTRARLIAEDVMRPAGAACYVWPQGVYTRTAGDPSFLDRALNAGFTCARGASLTPRGMCFAALSARNHQRLVLPIVGHTTAATFDGDTTDDAAETTNINTIVTSIQNLAAAGQDIHVMFHDAVQRGLAISGLTIETDRLSTLCAAIAAEVAANRLECVRMSDLLAP